MQVCSHAGMHQNGIPVNILAPERRFGKKSVIMAGKLIQYRLALRADHMNPPPSQ